MDQTKFEYFCSNTFEPARVHAHRRALTNQLAYKRLLWALTLTSILSAMTVSLQTFVDWLPLKIGATLITIFVSGLASSLKTFGFQEKATLYFRMWTDLENEWDLYQSIADHYAQVDDPQRYFVTRIRALIQESAATIPNITIPPRSERIATSK